MHRLIGVFFLLGILLVSACAPSSGRTIRVYAPSDFVQNPVWEFKELMSELGYERRYLLNPETGQPAPAVEMYGETRMLFAADDDPDIKVSVHINVQEGGGKLNLYQEGRKDLDTRADMRYKALVHRLVREFGQDKVR